MLYRKEKERKNKVSQRNLGETLCANLCGTWRYSNNQNQIS